jgi:hypothetical protein
LDSASTSVTNSITTMDSSISAAGTQPSENQPSL